MLFKTVKTLDFGFGCIYDHKVFLQIFINFNINIAVLIRSAQNIIKIICWIAFVLNSKFSLNISVNKVGIKQNTLRKYT